MINSSIAASSGSSCGSPPAAQAGAVPGLLGQQLLLPASTNSNSNSRSRNVPTKLCAWKSGGGGKAACVGKRGERREGRGGWGACQSDQEASTRGGFQASERRPSPGG